MIYIDPDKDSLITKIDPISQKPKIKDKTFDERLFEKMENKMKSQPEKYKSAIKKMAADKISDTDMVKDVKISPPKFNIHFDPEFEKKLEEEIKNYKPYVDVNNGDSTTPVSIEDPEVLSVPEGEEEMEIASLKSFVKTSEIDDDDDEPEYFEETNPIEMEDDEELPVKRTPKPKADKSIFEEMVVPKSGEDVSESLEEKIKGISGRDKEEDAELSVAPKKLKKKLKEEQKSFSKEERLRKIKELAEKIRARKEEHGVTKKEEAPSEEFEVVREESALPDEFKEEVKEAEELETEDLVEAEEAVEEKPEGEKPEVPAEKTEGEESRGRGRQVGDRPGAEQRTEDELMDIEELRLAAYGLKNMKSYGLSSKEIDTIFDIDTAIVRQWEKVKKYRAKTKLEDVEEPELWEMAEGQIPEAKTKSMKTLFNLIKEAYAVLAESEVYEKENEKKRKSEDKVVKERIKSAVESAEKKADREKDKIEKLETPFNEMEAEHAIKYYNTKVQQLTKMLLKKKNSIVGLKDRAEEEQSDRDLARSILQKEKDEKKRLKDKGEKRKLSPEDVAKYTK